MLTAIARDLQCAVTKNRIEPVMLAFCGNVSRAGILENIKITEEFRLVLNNDFGFPLSAFLNPGNADVTAGVTGTHLLILQVLGLAGQPQIGDAVVGKVAVDVVETGCRPFAEHQKPHQPVGGVMDLLDGDDAVAAPVNCASDLTGISG